MLTINAISFYRKIQPLIVKYRQLEPISTEKDLIETMTSSKYKNTNTTVIVYKVEDAMSYINAYVSHIFSNNMIIPFRWSHRRSDDLSYYEDSYLAKCLHEAYNIDFVYCEQLLNFVKYMAFYDHYEHWVDLESWEHPIFKKRVPISYDEFKHIFGVCTKPKWYFRLLHYACSTLIKIETILKNQDTLVMNLLSSPLGAIVFGFGNVLSLTSSELSLPILETDSNENETRYTEDDFQFLFEPDGD